MNKRFFANKQGFTLLEAVLSIALSALILIPATEVFMFASKTWKSQDEYFEMMYEARIAMDRILNEIRRADSITIYYSNRTFHSWLRQFNDQWFPSYLDGCLGYISLCSGGGRSSAPPATPHPIFSGTPLLTLSGKGLLDAYSDTDEETKYYYVTNPSDANRGGIWRYFKITGSSNLYGEDYLSQNVRRFEVSNVMISLNSQDSLLGARVNITTQTPDGSQVYDIRNGFAFSRNILLKKLNP